MNSFLLNISLCGIGEWSLSNSRNIKEENQRTQGTYSSSNSFVTTSQPTNPSPSTHKNDNDEMVDIENEIIDDQKEEDQVIVDETPSNFKLHNQPTKSNNKDEKSRDGFRID